MSSSDFSLFSSLTDLIGRIASKEVSPVEVLEAQLARIEQFDPYYGAYVVLDREGAMAAARAAEKAIRAGAALGPLHGAPIAIKDLFGTENLPTRCGSAIEEDLSPNADAAVVANLRRAGAVVLGKAATTEFALSGYHPSNTPPQNPWGRDRWAGVSSSGSGVAVAAGLAFGALGTDTGGSVRFPAAANGIVGLKPRYDALSRDGVFPLSPSLDHVGTFARRVEDAVLLRRACAGDLSTGPASSATGPRRIGLDFRFIEENADPEVAKAVVEAIGVFERAGHTIVQVDFTIFKEFAALWGPIAALEAWAVHQDLFARHADSYGPVFRHFLELGREISETDKAQLSAAREGLKARFLAVFGGVDALACPSAPLPAMPLAEFPPQLILPPEVVSSFVTFTAAANLVGAPTISAPCGRSAENLPLSLQLIGPMTGEETIVGLMSAYEAATDWKSAIPKDPPA